MSRTTSIAQIVSNLVVGVAVRTASPRNLNQCIGYAIKSGGLADIRREFATAGAVQIVC